MHPAMSPQVPCMSKGQHRFSLLVFIEPGHKVPRTQSGLMCHRKKSSFTIPEITQSKRNIHRNLPIITLQYTTDYSGLTATNVTFATYYLFTSLNVTLN